jgi:prepilin-type N-terminal cleavage/methylation domain-containing protein
MTRHSLRSDAGITMIELMATLALASVLMATATWTLKPLLRAYRLEGTATDVRSTLRNAAERSLSEGRTMCVAFTATTWTMYKGSCVTGTKVDGAFKVADPQFTLTPTFVPPATAIPNQTTACATGNACAYFYPRGNALAGTVRVARTGKSYTVTVEGLTARVSKA